MSDLVLRTATKAAITRHSMAQKLVSYVRGVAERAHREQTAQDMIEYAGVLVVVAGIIGGIVAFVPQLKGTLTADITKEIKAIFGN